MLGLKKAPYYAKRNAGIICVPLTARHGSQHAVACTQDLPNFRLKFRLGAAYLV
jgi:hypothetical protein